MKRVRFSFAFVLIAIGLLYLAMEFLPKIGRLINNREYWPVHIIAIGVVFALAALVTWMPSFFIPASVMIGIGGLLYWQNSTGNWASWSYAWTLIPGFAGFGLLLFGLLARKRGAYISGMWNFFSSIILFGIFASTLGHLPVAAKLWPAALIVLGLIVIISGFRKKKKITE